MSKSRRVSRSLSRTSKAQRSSSARSDDAYEQAMMNANGMAAKRGMVLPFTPLSIAFHHINYFIDMPAVSCISNSQPHVTIPLSTFGSLALTCDTWLELQEMKAQGISENKLQLLNDINGAFRPGVLTALMGVSGAGKTTLMDVLAGRKTGGYIEGNIWINGFPKKQETFARISGYCEQFDIHSPNVTVHESLIYSAWLRLSKDIKPSVRKVRATIHRSPDQFGFLSYMTMTRVWTGHQLAGVCGGGDGVGGAEHAEVGACGASGGDRVVDGGEEAFDDCSGAGGESFDYFHG